MRSEKTLMPRIYGPIADSWVIEKGESPNIEWLTPEREWQGSIFEAARFELDERKKAEWWLQREVDTLFFVSKERGKDEDQTT